MAKFFDKYLVILTTTRDILLQPFAFGEGFEDSPAETKRAATYLGEGVIFFYSLFKLAASASGTEIPYANIPYSAEILASVLVLSTMLTGLITHPIARWISGSETSIHGSLASFLYWSGFCLFVIPPIFTGLIMATDWLFAALHFGEDMKFFFFMFFGVPLFFVYYIGTISTWIAHAYRTEPILGGIAVAIAYTLSMAAGWALMAAVSVVA